MEQTQQPITPSDAETELLLNAARQILERYKEAFEELAK